MVKREVVGEVILYTGKNTIVLPEYGKAGALLRPLRSFTPFEEFDIFRFQLVERFDTQTEGPWFESLQWRLIFVLYIISNCKNCFSALRKLS